MSTTRYITTMYGAFEVLSESTYGQPLTVRHSEPCLRGSWIEAQTNMALALRNVYRAFNDALPAWISGWVEPAAPWWSDRTTYATEEQFREACEKVIRERRSTFENLAKR